MDQTVEKRDVARNDVFIKGRKKTLDDFITFLANVMTISKMFTKIDKKYSSSQILNVQLLIEIADVVSSAEYKKFDENVRREVVCMTHTIFLIFSTSSPSLYRWKKDVSDKNIENTISPKEVNILLMMYRSFLNQLQLFCITSSVKKYIHKTSSLCITVLSCFSKTIQGNQLWSSTSHSKDYRNNPNTQ